MKVIIRNILGSFADSAVLLPLLLLLVSKGLYSPTILFASAGMLYVFSGAFFRIPIPVQPLKSVAIAALALGANSSEIRISAGLVGVCCVLLFVFRAERWLALVPSRVVQQVQLGLGILLMLQAWRILSPAGQETFFGGLALTAAILLLPEWAGIPWMGLIAAGAVIFVSFYTVIHSSEPMPASSSAGFWAEPQRASIIAMLVLPQLALTMANSVLGTAAAAQSYFPRASGRVTERNLLASIGFGNILLAFLGGLPFCHGSGGLTANVRGGASSYWANFVIGGFLCLMAAFFYCRGGAFTLPPVFMGTLLLATGVHHLRLARSTAQQPGGIPRLLAAACIAGLSQNLLWVLVAAFAMEMTDRRAFQNFTQSRWRLIWR